MNSPCSDLGHDKATISGWPDDEVVIGNAIVLTCVDHEDEGCFMEIELPLTWRLGSVWYKLVWSTNENVAPT